MASKIMITMACSSCRNKNYYFSRSEKLKKKLVLNKFCKKCRAHTEHKSTK
ncbi:MAG: 50S ribosomal protein L33 [Endomicrobium sp.]|nr:50S ribosomal protein L33 [Endomicrobium sp.]